MPTTDPHTSLPVTVAGTPARAPRGVRALWRRVLTMMPVIVALALAGARAFAADTPATPDATPTAGTETSTAPATVSAPADLHDLDAWIAYRTRAQIPMLPDEARVFYRRGLIAWKSGEDAEAVRLLRGAAALDPTFLSPHTALATWFVTREPTVALQECAAALALLRRDFLLQLDLVANASFFALTLLFLGLVGGAVLVIAAHHSALRHMWQERFARVLTPATARLWPWLLLVLPFCAGIGLALPAIALLGMLWPVLRARERALMVTLTLAVVLAPFTPIVMGRLALPLRTDAAPFYSVATLEHEGWSAERQRQLEALHARAPHDPFVAFGLGWIARRGEDLATAEAAYRGVLAEWPDDDRAMVDLGHILAVQGRFAEALGLYDRALKLDPTNAAAWFDQSQVYTRQFDFRRASESVSRASALDFDLVQRLQNASVDGALPLADQWIEPATFWRAMRGPAARAAAAPVVPPAWRGAIEVSSPWIALLALLLAAGSVLTGLRWHRALPLRTCSNCGTVVCRRCSERRREVALCPDCSAVEARAETSDFGRVLLGQQRRKVERARRSARVAVASLVPGFGHALFQDVLGSVLTSAVVAWLVMTLRGVTPPFDARHDFGIAGPGVPAGMLFLVAALVYGVSILRFVTRQAQLDARHDDTPIRSRAAQFTHRRAEAA